MLKFWKKKPPAADQATPPAPAPAVADAAATAPAPPLDEAAIDAIAGGGTDIAGADAYADDAGGAFSDGDPADAAAAADEDEAPARRSWRDRLAGSGFARGLASI